MMISLLCRNTGRGRTRAPSTMSTPTRPSSASASGASAEAVLRRLESWAQADDQAAEEESSEGQAVVATGTLDGKLTLTAVSRDGPPPGGLAPHAPVTSRYELEAYVLDAGRALRARSPAEAGPCTGSTGFQAPSMLRPLALK